MRVTAGVVDDDGVIDALLTEFERGEGRALQPGPSLVDPDVHGNTAFPRDIDRRESRAPIHRRQPSGIAMGEDVHCSASQLVRRSDESRAVLTNSAAGLDILLGHRASQCEGAHGAIGTGQGRHNRGHPHEGPFQIDRRRTRRRQAVDRGRQSRVARIRSKREGETIGRGDPDEGRAAHTHLGNSATGVFGVSQDDRLDRVRKPGLIENLDLTVRIDPDRPPRSTGDQHAGAISRRPASTCARPTAP